jgi:hypothetical protein
MNINEKMGKRIMKKYRIAIFSQISNTIFKIYFCMIQKVLIHKNFAFFIICNLIKRQIFYNDMYKGTGGVFPLIPNRFRLGTLAAPGLEFHVQRTDGIDEDHQNQGIQGLVQIANAPGDGDNRQVDQVGVKTGAAHLADQRNAEEPGRKSLATQE